MALSKSSLKDRIISELQSQGFVTEGEHAMVQKMAEAIANAVVDEIQANAKANVTSGSSAGSWSIT
ncbi:hypothetical protein KW478_19630 [Vibrio fluvialis]|nr:hypothetical protein [Vibrio fluvialis]